MKNIYFLSCLISLYLFPQNFAEGQSFFSVILPEEYSIQYAGSVGFISMGINYRIKQDNFDFGISYGYVPESLGGKLDIISSKLKFKPFKIKVKKNQKWFPFNPIFFISYTLNKNFYLKWPKDQYPDDYYWWNSALRLHSGLSTDYKIFFSEGMAKSLCFYFEINSNDLYFISYWQNKETISLGSILKLGIGIKVGI